MIRQCLSSTHTDLCPGANKTSLSMHNFCVPSLIVFVFCELPWFFWVNRKILKLPPWNATCACGDVDCTIFPNYKEGSETQLLNCHVLQTTWQHENQELEDRSLAQSATQWWSCKKSWGWEQDLSAFAPLMFSAVVFVVGEAALCTVGCLVLGPGFYLPDTK